MGWLCQYLPKAEATAWSGAVLKNTSTYRRSKKKKSCLYKYQKPSLFCTFYVQATKHRNIERHRTWKGYDVSERFHPQQPHHCLSRYRSKTDPIAKKEIRNLLLWDQTTSFPRTASSLVYFKRDVDWPWKRKPYSQTNIWTNIQNILWTNKW